MNAHFLLVSFYRQSVKIAYSRYLLFVSVIEVSSAVQLPTQITRGKNKNVMLIDKDILPKNGIDAVSPLATIDGPPIYTIAKLSINDECGANATTGAITLVDCFPITFKRKPPAMNIHRIRRAATIFSTLYVQYIK